MDSLIKDKLLKDCKDLLAQAGNLSLIEGEGYDSRPTEELEIFLDECEALSARLNKFV